MNTFLLIFYIILFILIIYYKFLLIKSYIFEPILINKQIYFNNINNDQIIIKTDSLPKAYLGTNYTFNFWIFLKNVSENECKGSHSSDNIQIFEIYNSKNKSTFVLELNQKDSSLNIKIINNVISKLKSKGDNIDVDIDLMDSMSSTEINNNEIYHKVIHNLPNQKWMNISLNIENKYIDVYVNGRLYNSFYCFHNIEIVPPGRLTFYNVTGMNGYISRFRYFNKTLNYKRVKSLYDSGLRNPNQTNILWWTK